ncbi:MAG: nicotinamide mononucleotide transporter [Microbacteriaceae bacterium]|nr:nicotinamide mononucleotide transporter [Microbacteriaceae bacterium]
MTGILDWFAAEWTEVVGFVTGALCVFLAARRNIWNFPIGVANNVVFIVLFLGSALYADTGLQVVYLVLAVMGWVNWARNRAADDRPLVVRMPGRAILPLVASTVVAAALLAWLLTFTDSTTVIADAATTAVSLAAQYMLNRRWIENWFVWIAVDVVYIGLYAYKGLLITGALYLLFIGLCVGGYLGWLRVYRRAHDRVEDRAAVDA